MLKTLPPTLREKKRYIAFKIIYDEELKEGEVVNLIRKAVLDYYGAWGTSKANPWLVYYEFPYGILRCQRDNVDYVKSSLILAREFKNKPINIICLGVSGTIRKAKIKFLGIKNPKRWFIIKREKLKSKKQNKS
ncbi:Ribonuclease P protein component 2 [Methanocaldococcus lauensis]|uniref:Ribonuclease P protein component 2 n=1 Tax=Methanocaldococcus lauensis TaxID=2546128 RepID=A0A8D6PSR9_9EURY|nr:Rpp14/Pop5 family protein [Methanocaldococcus lauensis]CAB3287830.1 Ribonuclease P protein component 2 [Methanocaldococcus lauensis]